MAAASSRGRADPRESRPPLTAQAVEDHVREPACRRNELGDLVRGQITAKGARLLGPTDKLACGFLEGRHLRQLLAALLRIDECAVARIAVGDGSEEAGERLPFVLFGERRLSEQHLAIELLAENRVDQRLLRGEAAEHGAVTDAGAPRHLVDADVDPALGEALLRRAEDEVEVSLRVGPHAPTTAAPPVASASMRATSRLRRSASISTSAATTNTDAPANA